MRKTLVKIQSPRKCQENYGKGFCLFLKKIEMSCVMPSVSASVHVDQYVNDEMRVEHEAS